MSLEEGKTLNLEEMIRGLHLGKMASLRMAVVPDRPI